MAKEPRLNRYWESLKIESGAGRFRGSTGGGADFASPAGRVRGRRRAAPSAFVVAAAGRQVAEGRALRADTKRRGAPFTKTRVTRNTKASGPPPVESRKRFAPSSMFGDIWEDIWGQTPVGCLQILTNYTNFVLICECSCQFVDMTKRALGIGPDRGRQ